jgi:hypothetical protein
MAIIVNERIANYIKKSLQKPEGELAFRARTYLRERIREESQGYSVFSVQAKQILSAEIAKLAPTKSRF